ncbi:MAG: hypothetical protein WCT49_04910 [Candidatus Paceibacterota bacterium]|nr:hypothetical protein [Candidatus Paceibacterota bacterium]
MEKIEKHPFTDLQDSEFQGVQSKLYRVPGHEDMVIRKSFVDVPRDKDDEIMKGLSEFSAEDAKKMAAHEKAEYLKKKSLEFKKIVDRLGIPMAKTDYVIAESTPGTVALFGATERVEGKNLSELSILDERVADMVDDLYSRIISDLIGSYKSGEYFWCDAKNPQFVFGKVPGDKDSQIYLVDADPDIIHWDSVPMERKEPLFWNRLTWLVSQMEDMEKKMQGNKGFRFKKAREALEKAKTESFDVM